LGYYELVTYKFQKYRFENAILIQIYAKFVRDCSKKSFFV